MPIMSLGCKHTSKNRHSYTMTSQMLYIMSSASFASEVTEITGTVFLLKEYLKAFTIENTSIQTTMIEQVL